MPLSVEFPEAAWLPLEAVLAHLGTQAGAGDAIAVEAARDAAGAYVESARPDLVVDGVFEPTPAVLHGAVLLAARLYARRGSPVGVASFAEFGPASVMRYDPDIERLLGLGRYARPVIG